MQTTEELGRMEREVDEIFCGKGVKRREVLHTGIYLAIVEHNSALLCYVGLDSDRKLGFKFELTVRTSCQTSI